MTAISLKCAGAALCLVACGQRPAATVELLQDRAIVHVETLGEYPSDVSRIVVAEKQSTRMLVDVAATERPHQIHALALLVGVNSLSSMFPEADLYRMTHPEVSGTFVLARDIEYVVRIWGESSRPTEVVIRFPS